MAKIGVNFLVILAALILTISAMSLAEKYGYDQTSCSQKPGTQAPMCQKINQLCIAYGVYGCCDGLHCFIPPKAKTGICVTAATKQATKPITNHIPNDNETRKCKKFGALCDSYGEYTCCKHLDCIMPPQFLGVGVCAMKGVPVVPLLLAKFRNTSAECQENGQMCSIYGPYTCCEGSKCHFIDAAVGRGLCAPL